MLRNILTLALPFLLLIDQRILNAQDVSQLRLKKGIDFSGSINFNTVVYLAKGVERRRDPFNWFVNGNLNTNLFGYSAPISFSYSNTSRSFAQPFNRFSFSPQYKWIRTHIGYSSLSFSDFTLAGHVFLGGGLELSPNNWRISAMYGRLRKAVSFDLQDSVQFTEASYRRVGYGIKVGYEANGDFIFWNIFTAKDDPQSLQFTLPEVVLYPEQNVSSSIAFRKNVFKKIFLQAEYAVSALNKNVFLNRGEIDTVKVKTPSNFLGRLLPENACTRYFDAIRSSVGYDGPVYSVRLQYERIAPEYQSLGAYYFNNDLENITIAPAVRLLKNTLHVSANGGIQTNNLDGARASSTRRLVTSINLNHSVSSIWSYTLNYSNFTTFTNSRPQGDPFFSDRLDSLNFYQISQTMNATVVRTFKDQLRPQTVSIVVGKQSMNEDMTRERLSSDFFTMNIAYSYTYVPTHTSLALAANLYLNKAADVETKYFGPTVSFSTSTRDKRTRLSWAGSYNLSSVSGKSSHDVLNNRINVNHSPAKNSSSSFSLGLNALNRLKGGSAQPRFSEYTCTFSYTYAFK